MNYRSSHCLINDVSNIYYCYIDLSFQFICDANNQSGISFHMDTPSEKMHTLLMARIQETAFL